jgi:predicted N-acetyltransferase YhbS
MSNPETIAYTIEEKLDPSEFIDVLKRSGLDARRPVDNPAQIATMARNAGLVVCARNEAGLLVGVARSVTDFAYCCYVSDLAVDKALQRRGIGKELLARTHEAAGGREKVTLLLLSAPDGLEYYPKVGMKKLETCFAVPRGT